MHPKDLKIENFTYNLPTERIAYKPVCPRDSSKLLVYKDTTVKQDEYSNLATHLTADYTLVFNDTRVIKSRLFFYKETGAKIEIFCLEPFGVLTDYAVQLQKTQEVVWKCLVGNAAKWKGEELLKTIEIAGKTVVLKAVLLERLNDAYKVKLKWTPENKSFSEIIEAAGDTPLPPYIKRKTNKKDEESYQTVYSHYEGSVAAPTAGLHFSTRVLQSLKAKQIDTLFTTLHVGAGTFKPVKSNTMEGHVMHDEWMNITTTFLKQLLAHSDKKLISVGTTSMRTLESIYWMGNKVAQNHTISMEALRVSQWEPYEKKENVDKIEAIQALLYWMKERNENHLSIETGIIIAPGYSFKMVEGLITNFHQPQSTLLLLVSALIGDKWKSIYEYALAHDFRFLSYGDGSLLLP